MANKKTKTPKKRETTVRKQLLEKAVSSKPRATRNKTAKKKATSNKGTDKTSTHTNPLLALSPGAHQAEAALILKAIEAFHFEIPKEKKTKAQLKKGGRPPAINDQILRKLEYAFAFDSTVEEACIIAGIAPVTYYEFIKKYPAFTKTVALLRYVPMTLIRQTLVTGAMSDFDKALKYAAVKNKQEFSPKIELSHSGKIEETHDIAPEAKDAIDKVFALFEETALKAKSEYVVIE